MKLPGTEIDVIQLCPHGVDVTLHQPGGCTDCARLYPVWKRGYAYSYEPGEPGGYWQRATVKSFIACPHGVLIPLEGDYYGNFTLPKVTKHKWFCETCETQRAEGRAQEEQVKGLLKQLGRPRKYGPAAGLEAFTEERKAA